MGWVHNLQAPDPNNHIARVIAVCMTFASASLVAVALRFHIRIWVRKAVWIDDYAALLSAVLAMAYACVAVAQTRWGLGLNAEYFPAANSIPFSKMQYAGGPIYTLSLLGFKISLLASYLRIGGFVKMYRLVIHVAIVACVCNQIIFTFVLSFGCNPVAKQWDPSIPGKCINTVASYYGLAATSLAFDVVIIALPLPILLRLQLKLRQKIFLAVLFGLGFFVTIIQIIRVFTVKNLRTYTDSQPIIIWSIVEISLGVIISCVPTYGPYVRALSINISSYRRTRRPTYDASEQSGAFVFGRPGRSGAQSYNLSSRNPKSGGSRVYDNSVPTTGVVGSPSVRGKNYSTESILADHDGMGVRDSVEDGVSRGHGQWYGQEREGGAGGKSKKGIHIATEVRVESGPRGKE